jgi:hypothetical protein
VRPDPDGGPQVNPLLALLVIAAAVALLLLTSAMSELLVG